MKEKLLEILKEYYDSDDECYRRHITYENGVTSTMDDEVQCFFNSNGIVCKTKFNYGFGSRIYACDTLSIAWIENGEIFLHNVLIEYV